MVIVVTTLAAYDGCATSVTAITLQTKQLGKPHGVARTISQFRVAFLNANRLQKCLNTGA